MDDRAIPQENIDIYCYLFEIETALRELIIESLDSVAGPQWYKKRLPGDVLQKYREGRDGEKKIKWGQVVPHHPIYYIDFPHLKIVIEGKDNWKEVFAGVFGNKDIVTATLSELENIRNKIAHNRKATCSDVDVVKAAYAKLSAALTEERFAQLTRRCTCAPDISERLIHLREEAKRCNHICRNLEPPEPLDVWKSVRGSWWFDETYLGHSTEAITTFFCLMEAYTLLPRARGTGHKIESWVRHSNPEEKYRRAEENFRGLVP